MLQDDLYEIFVLEPNDQVLEKNRKLINSNDDRVKRVSHFDSLIINVDLTIIATPSAQRLQLLEQILSIGVKNYLLEKVVFQSRQQFIRAIALVESLGASVYCHFPRRYWELYRFLKKNVDKKNKPITIDIAGGDFGLASNAIHFLDLLQFLTGDKPQVNLSKFHPNEVVDKRGIDYRSFTGTLKAVTKSGSKLTITSCNDERGMFHTNIRQGSTLFQINELSGELRIFKEGAILKKKYDVAKTFSSHLTKEIIDDILTKPNQCILPNLYETMDVHSSFFDAVNKNLGLAQNENTICPIT